MKPFNLEEYLANPSRKVVTRDGRKLRIICTDKKGNDYPIVALIEETYGESYVTYNTDGKVSTSLDSRDIFFAPEKKEGWINIYKDNWSSGIYHSKEDAFNHRETSNYTTTIKIEWEE